jgi:hypothetical protein
MLKRHGIDRQEWERRFRARIAQCAFSTEGERLNPAGADEIATAELESWPKKDNDDWLVISPEEAADEQMSNWTDDGDEA